MLAGRAGRNGGGRESASSRGVGSASGSRGSVRQISVVPNGVTTSQSFWAQRLRWLFELRGRGVFLVGLGVVAVAAAAAVVAEAYLLCHGAH